MTVWAVEETVAYTGTWVDSLWVTKELAEVECARLTKTRGDDHTSFEVEQWFVHDMTRDEMEGK